ncbi:hypothetical protein [Candidatus Blastococcus massiliensis]|uniref:hypothetical protein n=1 Tax=Candidatus Blastococcus massiliensis TaxID=1470358 RepID=UPI0005907BC5|nr:hypothetical protein [Candidatus Blastococcus massiliensis]
MRSRAALVAASVVVLLAVLAGAWLLLRPVDPAGTAVPAPITVPERSPFPSAPGAPAPEPTTGPAPTDVVPPPPLPDDDDDDDDPDDDDD